MPARVIAQPIELVSWLGEVTLRGRNLGLPGVPLSVSPPMLSTGDHLVLARGASVQVLGPAFCAGLSGPLELDLSAEGTWRVAGDGAVRFAGHGPGVERGRLRLSPSGEGTWLLGDGQIFVLSGEVRLEAPEAPETRLDAGMAARLLDGPRPIRPRRAAPPRRLLAATERYAPPPAWEPPGQTISLERIGQALTTLRQESREERETAACGCTEAGGPGEGVGDAQGSGSSPESFTSPVRVRIQGLPRVSP